ncbi:methyltransferase [Mycobacterium sp. djl-10]|nr:methyltransferase [Mycobacterium sp. djl-10]
MRYVLFPGRHHVLTRFQARYLAEFAGVDTTVIWAVTSANHQNTRRNPVPAHRREAAIELFSQSEGIRSLVVPVVDVPADQRFAEITCKAVAHATGITPSPADTVVACSTPAVAELYEQLGFSIAPVERGHPDTPRYPWQVLEQIATGAPWRDDAHPATVNVFDRYGLAEHIRTISADPIVSSEGALTDTRDYRSYSAAFDAAAERKWTQARPYVQPGRIVDIGCAAGAMLELVAADPQFAESDLYGIEVARHLFEECEHRKSQGVFANPNTFFYQRNILAGPVFPDASVDTTLTFALTHEIYSYGEAAASLRVFADTIARQTAPGGVWINSDVCGPDHPDRVVRLTFHEPGVGHPTMDLTALSPTDVHDHLNALNPAQRFGQFAVDFRRNAGVPFAYDAVDDHTVRLRLADAMEFLTRFSYVDNWLSETHEQFCGFSWVDWVHLADEVGLQVDPRSGPWRNDWLVSNAFEPAAALFTDDGRPLDWPVTHVLLAAQAVAAGR